MSDSKTIVITKRLKAVDLQRVYEAAKVVLESAPPNLSGFAQTAWDNLKTSVTNIGEILDEAQDIKEKDLNEWLENLGGDNEEPEAPNHI